MRKAKTVTIIGVLLAVLAAPVQAGVVTNESIDVNVAVFVPCANGGAGEIVDLSGKIHTLITMTINGNNVSGKVQSQPQGVSGVGQDTGDKYQGTGATQSKFKGSLNNGQFEQTFVNNFRVIGQGRGNNLLVHVNLHVTINANGDATATVGNISVECK